MIPIVDFRNNNNNNWMQVLQWKSFQMTGWKSFQMTVSSVWPQHILNLFTVLIPIYWANTDMHRLDGLAKLTGNITNFATYCIIHRVYKIFVEEITIK